jgi:uncharacterized protein (DUF2249 family)
MRRFFKNGVRYNPLYYHFEAEQKGKFEWEYEQEGPKDWIFRIRRI